MKASKRSIFDDQPKTEDLMRLMFASITALNEELIKLIQEFKETGGEIQFPKEVSNDDRRDK